MLKLLLRKLIFDNRCSLCGDSLQSQSYLCFKCLAKLKEMSSLKQRENLYYLYYYTDVKKIIFDFKFKNRRDIAKNLSNFVYEAIENILEKEKIDIIISTPINKNRLLERGYNQVDEFLRASGVEFVKIERVKNTEHMYKIKENLKREENVKNAFKIKGDYSEQTVLVVDDILTTGSTLKELERELKDKHKVKKIVFFTLAVVREYFK